MSYIKKREPRWLTITDLVLIVAGVALLMTRAPMVDSFFFPLSFLVMIGFSVALVLALVVLGRRAQYGGPIRSAEWLALGLASLALVYQVPDLDTAVNAYYGAVGSKTLDFGAARWMFSAPAAVGVVLVAAALLLLRRPLREGSHVASAVSAIGIVVGLSLWFWGPCAIGRLELPWLLIPSPAGNPRTWGWRALVVIALRDLVANAPSVITCGALLAATQRAWKADRCAGPSRAWVWTEPAAFACASAAALMFIGASLLDLGSAGTLEVTFRTAAVVAVGLASYWITSRLAARAVPTPDTRAERYPDRQEQIPP